MGTGPILNYKQDYKAINKDYHDPTPPREAEPEQARNALDNSFLALLDNISFHSRVGSWWSA